MPHTDPLPRDATGPRAELPWQSRPLFKCSFQELQSSLTFAEVLRFRRSSRRLTAAPLREVSSVIASAASCLYLKNCDNQRRSLRPAISSGAIHPIEIVFLRSQKFVRLFHFDSFTSVISVVHTRNPEPLRLLWQKAKDILPDAVSTLLILIARRSVLEEVYTDSESLLWRDGGALLQTLSMTACSVGLGFCPLGLLGSEIIDALPTSSEKLEGVGTAWLGQIK